MWDYPRPPAWRMDDRSFQVRHRTTPIAQSRQAVKAMEAGAPPRYCLPAEDVRTDLLQRSGRKGYDEWKGRCVYYDLRLPDEVVPDAVWTYPEPNPAWVCLRGRFGFNSALLECSIDGERARPAPDDEAGWVTGDVIGPFRGGAGAG